MTLAELEPYWLKIIDHNTFACRDVPMAEAQGFAFLCPKCLVENKGKTGTHSIYVWRTGVPQTISPSPGRWEWSGAGFESVTLNGSVRVVGGCASHFNVISGQIVILP